MILGYLNDKYSDLVTGELLGMASLIDPRFQVTYTDHDTVDQIKNRAVTELMSLLAHRIPPQPGPAVQVHQIEAQSELKQKKTLLSFFKKKVLSSSLSEADKIETKLATNLLSAYRPRH